MTGYVRAGVLGSHPEIRSWMLPCQWHGVRVNRSSKAAPSLLSPFSRILLHKSSEPASCGILLWVTCNRSKAIFFFLVGCEEGEGRKRLEWVWGGSGDRRALWGHQQERQPLHPTRETHGKAGSWALSIEFPLISWKICKVASSYRSSGILGALQRIILKTYNKIIEGLVCQ